MRLSVITALCVACAMPASAQDAQADCDRQVEVVMIAVEARKAGDSAGKTRRVMRKDFGRTAADMLVDFVYSVPEEQIDDISDAYRAQCEAM